MHDFRQNHSFYPKLNSVQNKRYHWTKIYPPNINRFKNFLTNQSNQSNTLALCRKNGHYHQGWPLQGMPLCKFILTQNFNEISTEVKVISVSVKEKKLIFVERLFAVISNLRWQMHINAHNTEMDAPMRFKGGHILCNKTNARHC